mmetsp:Transcript_34533/g.87294  ORF Transcript_34533/g.87294 Transcript_34533/m.87294 type:complete len:473 (+) Transcript_34533:703-2121(+)
MNVQPSQPRASTPRRQAGTVSERAATLHPALAVDAALVRVRGGQWHQRVCAVALRGLPRVRRLVVAQPHAAVVLLRADDLGVGVHQRLAPVRAVAHDAWQREQHGEELGREAKRAVHQAAVKVDVGVQLARHKVLVLQRRVLQRLGHLDERVAARNGEHLLRHLLDDLGARVKVAVHAVPKPKQLLLLGLDARQERGDGLHLADARQHAQHGLVGAAVQRAVQRAHRACHGRVHIHARGRQVARGGSGAVHLVLRVQDEHDVQCAHELGVRLVGAAAVAAIQHVHEVLRVAQALVGRRGGAAGGLVVRPRRQGGDLAQQAHNLLVLHLARLVDVAAHQCGVLLGVQRGQRADAGEQHAHGVRVSGQRLHRVNHGGGQRGVAHDRLLEGCKLRHGGQVAEQHSVRNLQEVAPLGQLLNGVAPVAQDALLAINIGDARDDCRGVRVPGVICTQSHTVATSLDLLQGLGIDGAPL